jgi:hypothetical protein
VLGVLTVNLLTPLRSPAALIAMLGLLAVALVTLVVWRQRWTPSRLRPVGSLSRWDRLALIAVCLSAALVTIYLAVAALGPVTNYDSGLYHLGAVRYAGDFRTIPGLANLYQAFGYNNSLFPFAAFLGNGPWNGEGFRLANGLVVAMMSADLVLRFLDGSRKAGSYVLLIGAVAAWVPLVALSDYWVTSPTSDSAVMIFSLVSLAYLADALRGPEDFAINASVAASVAVVAFSMRPTMAAFLAGVVVVLVVRAWRMRRGDVQESVGIGLAVAVVVLSVLLVVVQTIRDFLLSGWLMYPLSLWRFDVPWIALDPINTRTATLGYARDPANYLDAAHGWSWVGPWLSRLPQQWEVFEFAALTAFAVMLGFLAHRRNTARVLTLSLALLIIPSILAVVVWWVFSPPSFRFIWGPLFGLAVAPAGWFLHLLAAHDGRTLGARAVPMVAVATTVVIVLLTGYSAIARIDVGEMTKSASFALGPVAFEYSVAPIPISATTEVVMPSGLVLRRPKPTDQCWNAYPLCTPLIESAVSARGEAIQDGFDAK